MFSGNYGVKFVYVFLKLIVSCLRIDRRNLKRKPTEVTFLPFLEPKMLLIYVLWTENEFLLGAML